MDTSRKHTLVSPHKYVLRSPMLKSREEHLRQLNQWSPFMLALVLCIAGAYGVGVAIPALYISHAWRRGMQMVACFSFVELVSHWCLTRFTDASYVSHDSPVVVKGIEPPPRSPNYGLQPVTLKTQRGYSEYGRPSFGVSSNGVVQTVQMNGEPSEYNRNDINSNPVTSTIVNIPENSASWKYDHIGSLNGRRNSHAVLDNYVNGFELELERSKKDHKEQTDVQYQMISWRWTNCVTCGHTSPPRSHHCHVCQKCILKRQHHCFLTGVCIGAANQRHFLAFLLWAMVVTSFGTTHMVLYALGPVIKSGQACYWDLIPLVILYRAILGHADPLLFPLCVTFWIVLALTVAALVFLGQSLALTLLGLTEAEYSKNVKIVDQRRLPERLRYVLGENWLLNFIIPFRRRTKFYEDAINWPFLKRPL